MADLPPWSGSSSGAPGDGTVTDVKVAAGAGIQQSKLALAITDAQIAAGAAIAKSKLAALAIADADVAAGAGIAQSKLALAITDAQIAAGAAIAKSKLAALAIVDADVAAGAAIAGSKLADAGVTPAKTSFLSRTDVAAVAQQDIAIPSTDGLVIVTFDLETSALCELRLLPNALATAIYTNVRDGSIQSTAASSAQAATGNTAADNNGIRLAFPPNGASTGGQQMTGRVVLGIRAPTAAVRTAIAQAAVASITGSGNQLIELQNIAARIATNVAINSLRFSVSAGTMTGSIEIEHA